MNPVLISALLELGRTNLYDRGLYHLLWLCDEAEQPVLFSEHAIQHQQLRSYGELRVLQQQR